jgi:hypothetical protein
MSHVYAAPTEQSAPQANPPNHIRRVAFATLAAVAVGGLGYLLGYQSASNAADDDRSVAAAAEAAQADARLSQAYEACTSSDSDDTVSLSDGGRTIVIDTRSEYGDPSGMDCVLSELDTPTSTRAAIGRTTSLMGVQDDDQDGISYSWSYHPDNGVNMVITLDD